MQSFSFIPHTASEELIFSSSEPKPHKVVRPSSVRRPSVVVHTFKLEYLWSQLVNLDQVLCVASLGWGKGCIRFWIRLDQNSGFHSNRNPPLTSNGENDVATLSRLFFIRSFLYLQVTRTCIKTRTWFGQIGPLTTELAGIGRLNCLCGGRGCVWTKARSTLALPVWHCRGTL